MRKIFFFTFVFLLVSFLFFLSGWADDGLVPNRGGEPLDWCDFFEMINNVIKFLTFKLALPLSACLIGVGGFLFLFSGGEPQKISQAKTFVTAAIVGVILAFCAFLIIDTLVSFITGRGGLAGLLNIGGIMSCP